MLSHEFRRIVRILCIKISGNNFCIQFRHLYSASVSSRNRPSSPGRDLETEVHFLPLRRHLLTGCTRQALSNKEKGRQQHAQPHTSHGVFGAGQTKKPVLHRERPAFCRYGQQGVPTVQQPQLSARVANSRGVHHKPRRPATHAIPSRS